MNSETSGFEPNASGIAPKQSEYIPPLKLSDGNEIPMLGYGLGTARSKRGNKDELDEKIINDTLTAIKNGYYHLDGAEFYGNESELGAAIARCGVPRAKLFITTKTSCLPGESIETAFSRSLAKLGLDYVDLYLIHSPFWASSPADLQQKWTEMEALKDAGRARSIGVSNFLREHLEAVLATPGGGPRHPPVVNQIEFHPYLQHDDDGGLVAFHREKGIAVQAYSPLTAVTKAAPGPVDEVYERVAKKYGVTPGEVALRWCLDQGIVAVTTSSNEQRLKEWMTRLPLFKLTPKEVGEISERGKEKHFRGFWNKEFAEDDRR
ncbi:NADP-dependent oxidoreductase domain-containing protein [Chaetomidium leptoderma]|uniref:NADP-dependent oxidoreductase domain-containing protein n=1 Tax=Chaetomidium leptoderma TaxID=669021 RepID=A0AAN6VEK5_9PEZI|nr:NADP-dependent oxidoreductase domain-containing protein [Chaetomidium leptoderma]